MADDKTKNHHDQTLWDWLFSWDSYRPAEYYDPRTMSFRSVYDAPRTEEEYYDMHARADAAKAKAAAAEPTPQAGMSASLPTDTAGGIAALAADPKETQTTIGMVVAPGFGEEGAAAFHSPSSASPNATAAEPGMLGRMMSAAADTAVGRTAMAVMEATDARNDDISWTKIGEVYGFDGSAVDTIAAGADIDDAEMGNRNSAFGKSWLEAAEVLYDERHGGPGAWQKRREELKQGSLFSNGMSDAEIDAALGSYAENRVGWFNNNAGSLGTTMLATSERGTAALVFLAELNERTEHTKWDIANGAWKTVLDISNIGTVVAAATSFGAGGVAVEGAKQAARLGAVSLVKQAAKKSAMRAAQKSVARSGLRVAAVSAAENVAWGAADSHARQKIDMGIKDKDGTRLVQSEYSVKATAASGAIGGVLGSVLGGAMGAGSRALGGLYRSLRPAKPATVTHVTASASVPRVPRRAPEAATRHPTGMPAPKARAEAPKPKATRPISGALGRVWNAAANAVQSGYDAVGRPQFYVKPTQDNGVALNIGASEFLDRFRFRFRRKSDAEAARITTDLEIRTLTLRKDIRRIANSPAPDAAQQIVDKVTAYNKRLDQILDDARAAGIVKGEKLTALTQRIRTSQKNSERLGNLLETTVIHGRKVSGLETALDNAKRTFEDTLDAIAKSPAGDYQQKIKDALDTYDAALIQLRNDRLNDIDPASPDYGRLDAEITRDRVDADGTVTHYTTQAENEILSKNRGFPLFNPTDSDVISKIDDHIKAELEKVTTEPPGGWRKPGVELFWGKLKISNNFWASLSPTVRDPANAFSPRDFERNMAFAWKKLYDDLKAAEFAPDFAVARDAALTDFRRTVGELQGALETIKPKAAKDSVRYTSDLTTEPDPVQKLAIYKNLQRMQRMATEDIERFAGFSEFRAYDDEIQRILAQPSEAGVADPMRIQDRLHAAATDHPDWSYRRALRRDILQGETAFADETSVRSTRVEHTANDENNVKRKLLEGLSALDPTTDLDGFIKTVAKTYSDFTKQGMERAIFETHERLMMSLGTDATKVSKHFTETDLYKGALDRILVEMLKDNPGNPDIVNFVVRMRHEGQDYMRNQSGSLPGILRAPIINLNWAEDGLGQSRRAIRARGANKITRLYDRDQFRTNGPSDGTKSFQDWAWNLPKNIALGYLDHVFRAPKDYAGMAQAADGAILRRNQQYYIDGKSSNPIANWVWSKGVFYYPASVGNGIYRAFGGGLPTVAARHIPFELLGQYPSLTFTNVLPRIDTYAPVAIFGGLGAYGLGAGMEAVGIETGDDTLKAVGSAAHTAGTYAILPSYAVGSAFNSTLNPAGWLGSTVGAGDLPQKGLNLFTGQSSVSESFDDVLGLVGVSSGGGGAPSGGGDDEAVALTFAQKENKQKVLVALKKALATNAKLDLPMDSNGNTLIPPGLPELIKANGWSTPADYDLRFESIIPPRLRGTFGGISSDNEEKLLKRTAEFFAQNPDIDFRDPKELANAWIIHAAALEREERERQIKAKLADVMEDIGYDAPETMPSFSTYAAYLTDEVIGPEVQDVAAKITPTTVEAAMKEVDRRANAAEAIEARLQAVIGNSDTGTPPGLSYKEPPKELAFYEDLRAHFMKGYIANPNYDIDTQVTKGTVAAKIKEIKDVFKTTVSNRYTVAQRNIAAFLADIPQQYTSQSNDPPGTRRNIESKVSQVTIKAAAARLTKANTDTMTYAVLRQGEQHGKDFDYTSAFDPDKSFSPTDIADTITAIRAEKLQKLYEQDYGDTLPAGIRSEHKDKAIKGFSETFDFDINNQNQRKQVLLRMVDGADADGNGYITDEEWAAYLGKLSPEELERRDSTAATDAVDGGDTTKPTNPFDDFTGKDAKASALSAFDHLTGGVFRTTDIGRSIAYGASEGFNMATEGYGLLTQGEKSALLGLGGAIFLTGFVKQLPIFREIAKFPGGGLLIAAACFFLIFNMRNRAAEKNGWGVKRLNAKDTHKGAVDEGDGDKSKDEGEGDAQGSGDWIAAVKSAGGKWRQDHSGTLPVGAYVIDFEDVNDEYDWDKIMLTDLDNDGHFAVVTVHDNGGIFVSHELIDSKAVATGSTLVPDAKSFTIAGTHNKKSSVINLDIVNENGREFSRLTINGTSHDLMIAKDPVTAAINAFANEKAMTSA